MICATALILCLVAGSHQLSIEEFSLPQSVRAGDDADLKCVVSLSAEEAGKQPYIKWWWTPLHEPPENKHQLYQHIVGNDPQLLALDHHLKMKIMGNDTVKLLDLEPKYSGTYECELYGSIEVRRNQELIVYRGVQPVVNASLAADGPGAGAGAAPGVAVECAAGGVAPYPDLVVTLNGENLNVSEYVSDGADGLYDIYANVTVGKETAEGAEISCELFYRDEHVAHPPYKTVLTYEGDAAAPTELYNSTTDVAPDSLRDSPSGASRQCGARLTFLALAIPLHFYNAFL